MPAPGYYRFPALHRDTVVFASEDDLWTAGVDGGIARRLTASPGVLSYPFFSPDGSTLAFTGREEGHSEVYVMPADGGPVRRVTYLGSGSTVLGWTPDGTRILFATDSGQPFSGIGYVRSVSPEGGMSDPWPVGPALSISLGPDGRTALGRNNNDPARWKRYRGGTAGDLWIDPDGVGEFHRLIQLTGNVARPMWIGDRIYFLSDHEGIGNLYSCQTSGEDLRRHTHRSDYFVRFPNTDGERIVYQSGADLYLFDPKSGDDRLIEIDFHSPRTQRQRRFVEATRFLTGYAPHPRGHSVAVTARGKSFTMGNWEGAATPRGGDPPRRPVRFRLTRWLNDGGRVVTVTDSGEDEFLEIHTLHGDVEPIRLESLDIGIVYNLKVSPCADHVLLSNHRNELLFIDLTERTLQTVDRSPYRQIQGFDWSPDGHWAAYGFAITQYTTAIKLWYRDTGEAHVATRPVLHDTDPSFDPEGKYLYFLGQRDLNPVYDNLHFDLGFPRGVRPHLLTLRANLRSPFAPAPHPLRDEPKPEPVPEAEAEAEAESVAEPVPEPVKPPSPPVTIELEGIADRVVAFPVREGIYRQVAGIKGKALFTSFPVRGALREPGASGDAAGRGSLEVYDFESQKQETLLTGIADFQIAQDGKTLYYRDNGKLRAIKAGEKPDGGSEPGRKSGWIDLGRIRVSVEPDVEWRQMAREAWRLQREFFWTPDMSQVDWSAVWERYAPLLDRVGSRGEFSDLMWEMQGELGTSHAYEFGGDYRPEPTYPQGFLGADLAFDAEAGAFRIARIVRGAAGEVRACSPLLTPGVAIHEGEILRAINGRKLTAGMAPGELLVHQADSEVVLTLESEGAKPRDITIKALRSEFPARYREWVETNRRIVHEKSGGRAGYVHIPDMGASGYAEFHRLFLAEVDRDALLVDVRYNRGGHVSQLLIEKLARKRVGYDVQRWGAPDPYPSYSVAGPMVALTNQWAGSDGDIFCHVFKLKKLGPLVGKRTWGGVIGIGPRIALADGSITTQPEYSFWFEDVGWGVENYGTDPDIDIDVPPQDYARGHDPQLERAIALLLERLEVEPPVKPAFINRPSLALPLLPPWEETSK